MRWVLEFKAFNKYFLNSEVGLSYSPKFANLAINKETAPILSGLHLKVDWKTFAVTKYECSMIRTVVKIMSLSLPVRANRKKKGYY